MTDRVLERRTLTELTPYPGNPRRGDVRAIQESIAVHGQYAPLIIQAATGYVLAGNHTRLAMLAQGATDADVIVLDVGDAVARAIVAADNRHHDLGTYNLDTLLEALHALEDDENLAGSGYTAEDLEDLEARLTPHTDPVPGPLLDDLIPSPPTTPSGPRLRSLLLLHTADDAATFTRLVDVLTAQWGTGSREDTVARALRSVAASATY